MFFVVESIVAVREPFVCFQESWMVCPQTICAGIIYLKTKFKLLIWLKGILVPTWICNSCYQFSLSFLFYHVVNSQNRARLSNGLTIRCSPHHLKWVRALLNLIEFDQGMLSWKLIFCFAKNCRHIWREY